MQPEEQLQRSESEVTPLSWPSGLRAIARLAPRQQPARLVDRRGRAIAIASIYDQEATRAYRVALLVIGDTEEAARVVETSFLELAAMPILPTESEQRRVVLAAIHHALNDYQSMLPSAKQPTSMTSPALAALPQVERQALAYCIHGGVTVCEAAGLLGEAPQTIHQRLGRALRQLQVAVKPPRSPNSRPD